jgi:putative ABC transport system permease protein
VLNNYLTTAVRNIARHKLYSLINIIGLAVGLAVCIMILLFVRFETSFDGMHADNDRTYRLNWISTGTGAQFATFFNPVSPLIAEAMPGDVEAVTRIALTRQSVRVGEDSQTMRVSFVDPNFFEMFQYPGVSGTAADRLAGLNDVVLTRAAALRLFGRENVVGEVFTLDGQFDVRVTAVVENSPANSHMVSNVFFNIELLPMVWQRPDLWEAMFSDQLYHYMRLAPGVDIEAFEERVLDFFEANISEQARQFVGFEMQPLRDIHFTTTLQNEMPLQDELTGALKPLRQKSDIYIFGAVAALTLLIAAFNFMNLQIAQATRRVREVGIRKVLGANRRDVAAQFLIESMVLALGGLFGALMLVELFLPYFTVLVTAPLSVASLFDPAISAALFGTTLLVGLVSGFYPAMFIAGLIPTQILRGELIQGMAAPKIRAVLVVLQFAISIGLIASTGVVNSQISFAFNKALGFDPERIVTVNIGRNDARQVYATMRDRLLSNPDIELVSAASVVPTGSLSDGSSFSQPEGGDQDFSLNTRRISVSEDFFKTLGMEIVAGRALSEDFASDSMPSISPDTPEVNGGVIFNETAAKMAGWNNPEDAVGQRLYSAFSFGGTDYRMNYEVVGIINDAHYGSVRSDIAPISYTLDQSRNVMVIKVKAEKLTEAVAFIDEVWSEMIPDSQIERAFLDEKYAALYSEESKTFELFMGFAGIAAAIACLGLYGLASFAAERRTKEIGIRKVLGATVTNIVGLLSWDFSKMVVVANVIAWPVAWYLMADWLQAFAYRVEMEVGPFIIAGVLAFMLALATISIRAFKAARQNPVLALRYE